MSAKRPLWRTFIININNLMNTIHLQASRVISLPGPPGGRLKNVTAQISQLLLECKSIPAYVSMGHLLNPIKLMLGSCLLVL